MSDFTLFGFTGSPYVRSVAFCLEEKAVRWTMTSINPVEAQSPSYLERHPFGRVPAFEHKGFRLYESQAILRYLNRVVPNPSLVPEDAQAEARMNQICGITDWYVMPQVTMGIAFNRLVAPRLGIPVDESKIEVAIANAKVCVAEIVHLMGDHPYLAGKTISLADILLAPHLAFFALTSESDAILGPHQKLKAWLERMNTRRSFQITAEKHLAEKASATQPELQ
jgi:glutathione S-transferase